MADKQVNININYKVNTVEVEKAQGLLKQAQAASTSFENSAKQAGQTTATAFKTAGVSIETLNAKLASLKDRITKSSDPKAVAQLSVQYKALEKEITAANNAAFKTPKAMSETGKATQSLAGQFGTLYTAVKLAFTAGIIKEVASTVIELTKLAGNVEGVSRAFNRTFPNAVAMLENLKKSTHGTVSEFDLMQKALKAQNLGVPVQELGKLLEFAAVRAQQTGDSVDYLVNSIIDGLGRKSILKLDNLGISATRLKEAMGGISTQAATVAQVTEAFTKVAGEELQKMGGYAETSATKVDQLTTNFQELRVEVSKKIESSWFIDFLNLATDGAKALLKSDKDLLIDQARLTASQTATNLIESKAFKDLGDNQQKKLDFLQQEANSRVQLIGKYNDTITKLKEEREIIRDKNPYDERLDSITKQINANEKQKVVIASTILALKSYFKEFSNVNSVEEKSLGIIEKLQQDISELGDKIKQAHSVTDIENYNRQLVLLEARLRELNELGKTFVNPLASATFDIKDKLAKGKVSLKADDLINTAELTADTERLFGEIGEKAGKAFDLGVANEVDKGLSELQQTLEDRKSDIISAGIDITANALTELAYMEADSYDQRLRMLGEYYDNQIYLAGDNEKAKDRIRQEEKKKTDKLRREEAKKEQQARLYAILLNTAAGIAKAFATSATIYDAYVNAAIVAVEGAAQYAVASKSPRGFAKGVLNLNGKGNGTSDSIHAKLSKGESVMTAQEWKTSKNVLKEVRAKRLDDDVLASLKIGNDGVKVVGGMDDKRMIAKLDEIKNSMPDVEARGHLLYTTKQKSDNYRKWVRKSSMSN